MIQAAIVGDVRESDGKLSLTIERPYGQPSCGKVIVYGEKVWQFAVKADTTLDSVPAPKLENWQIGYRPKAMPDFDDSTWKSSDDPQQMGADGDNSAFAWYRATVDLKAAGRGTLHFMGKADDIVVLVNGKRYDGEAEFVKGKNQIAVLASHRGRQKAFNYLGTLNDYHRKGLFGPVQLEIGDEKINVQGLENARRRSANGHVTGRPDGSLADGDASAIVGDSVYPASRPSTAPGSRQAGPRPHPPPGYQIALPWHGLAQRPQPWPLSGKDSLPWHVSARMLAQGWREHARDL